VSEGAAVKTPGHRGPLFGALSKTIRIHGLTLAVTWTLFVGVSLAWNLFQQQRTVLATAAVIARTGFEKDILYRRWNAGHGGVYVPVTERTRPNPYLAEGPRRDFVSASGTRYTLINPAYMSRQAFELQQASTGILGHITSLKPIRPENAADPWERAALAAFEKGATEVSSVETLNGSQHLRLMRPLMVENACLACHAAQGYEVNDVRGGISESVPLAPLFEATRSQTRALLLGLGSVWALGIVGIYATSSRIGDTMQRLEKAKDALAHASTHDALTGLHNRTFFEENVRRLEEGKPQLLSALVVDLDGLKAVNDSEGHAAGDLLIQRAARVLQETFRTDDVVARTGGDEFVLLLPSAGREQAAAAVARLAARVEVENAARREGEPLLSLSIGSTTSEGDFTVADVLRRADEAMYAEKAARRGRRGSEGARERS